MSQQNAEASTAPADATWSVISITSSEPAALQDGWHDVLRLKFDDIDVPEAPYIMFGETHAQQIKEFMEKSNVDGVTGIIVHCHAGVSRSAGIAKWIADTYNLPFPSSYMLYNKHVNKVLRDLDQKMYSYDEPIFVG